MKAALAQLHSDGADHSKQPSCTRPSFTTDRHSTDMDNSPQSNTDDNIQQPPTDTEKDPDGNSQPSGDETPVLARVVDETPDRVGSPFAAAPSGRTTPKKPIVIYENLGPFQYTAMGGVVAAIMLLGFGIAALAVFPVGGCIIATLGCGAATLGLQSQYKRITSAILVTHACLFLVCFILVNA